MNRKQEIFEGVLKKAYVHDDFVGFTREFLNDIQLVAPTKYNKEYSNFSFYVDGYYHIGNYKTDDGDVIAVLSVNLHKGETVERARSMQRNFVKTLMERNGCAGAIVAFYTSEEPDKWRLSFIRMDYEFSKGKVDQKLTPAKRYSYLVGEKEPCTTALQRLFPIFDEDNERPNIDEIEDAFSVEKVTKEFFDKYVEKYHDLREYLESNEDFMIEAKTRGFSSEQFAKKLLGQIVFLYFIQKKGWLGVSAIPTALTEKEYNNAFYSKGAKSRELVPKVYQKIEEDKYKINVNALRALSDDDEAILAACVKGEPWGTGPRDFMRQIFKGCTAAGKNFFDDYLEPLFYTGLNLNRGENGFYAPLHRRIPFLNGGLFEQLDNYDWENNDFNIPNEIFSNVDEKGRDADGILDIFDRYNFTMNEDEPMEREVAIDPEMLGKVFENLLDVKDRKSKGAFYTPREIVHYMCQETLINYLVEKTGISESAIRDFILYGDFFKDEDTEKTKKVTDSNGKSHYEIDTEKELYISSEIFSFKNGTNRLEELDELLKNVKVADLAVGSGAFPLGMLNEIVKARETLTSYMSIGMNNFQKKSFIAYGRKLYDLKINTIKNCIFACDIEPSAVDIAKLRLWLSIVIDDEIADNAGNGEFDAHTKPRQLPNLECNIICGNSLVDEFMGNSLITKSAVLGNDENYQYNIFNASGVDSLIKKLIELQDKLFFVKEHNEKEELKNQIQGIYNEIILEQIGMDSGLTDAYYTSTKEPSKPFILWQLYFPKVFKDNGGFDIVIGNPPYIEFKKLDQASKDFFKTRYTSANGKYDIYVVFMEAACELLNKNGTLSFINPTMFMKRDYGKSIREFANNHYSIKTIIDFSDKQMFESATTYTGIFIYDKQENTDNIVSYYRLEKDISVSSAQFSLHALLASDYFSAIKKPQKDLGTTWAFENEEATEILANIANGTTPLKDLAKSIFQGIASGKDEVFYVDQDTINAYNLEPALLKRLYKGKDIKRYKSTWSGYYVIYPYTNNKLIAEDLLREKYSNTYNYLCEKRELLKGRGYFDKSTKEWYELWNQRDSNNFDEPTKIITAEINKNNNFYLDREQTYGNTKIYTIILKNNDSDFYYYMLGLLNSNVLEYAYKKLSVPKAGGFYAFKTQFMEQLPIKILATDDTKYTAVVELAKKLSDTYSEESEKDLNNIVYQIYGISDKQQEILEGVING